MESKETLMIDHDDVISEGGLLYLINEFLGTSYQKEDFTDYYMQTVIPTKYKNDFWNWYITKNRYDYDVMLPYAREVIAELDKYYNIYIGTSYIFSEIIDRSYMFLPQKSLYLQKELPFISPRKYSFTSDKSIFKFDVGIDDKLDNLVGSNKKLLFSQYHNQDVTNEELKAVNGERAENWLDVKKKLLHR